MRKIKANLNVVVKVDAKLKQLYTESLQRFTEATNEGAKSWDHRYEAIADILDHEPPLYLAGGFASESDFIKKVVHEDKSSLYRNLRVAKYANPEEIEQYTPSRLDLAITLVETKNGGPLRGRNPIAFEKLHFAFKRDGTLVTRAFADMSVEELRAAVAHAKGRDKQSKQSSPTARDLQARITKSKVKQVTFSLSAKTVTLRVPLAGLDAVAAALRGFTPPASPKR